ncbi:MAG: hypothetical protein ABJF50_00500 [Paracoccaceae bacterium]
MPVKLVHVEDMKAWGRLRSYEEHEGISLVEYKQMRELSGPEETDRLLLEVEKRLKEIDTDEVILQKKVSVRLPVGLFRVTQHIDIEAPNLPNTIVVADQGQVKGARLYFRSSWRKKKAVIEYLCPSNIIHRSQISALSAQAAILRSYVNENKMTSGRDRTKDKVIFVSHRWEGRLSPDPDGSQFKRLSVLENCYLIYDYCSFPQDMSKPSASALLQIVLDEMTDLIEDVIVLSAPDFMDRGWCLYEYIVASMRASLICDEINVPELVELRNLAATRVPVPMGTKGGGFETQLKNAKVQRTLELVNSLLPCFRSAEFSVPSDRERVQSLLVSELFRKLPAKQEYDEYTHEWRSEPWTIEEIEDAFSNELKWDYLQYNTGFQPYELDVATTLEEAVRRNYQRDEMPRILSGHGGFSLTRGFIVDEETGRFLTVLLAILYPIQFARLHPIKFAAIAVFFVSFLVITIF